MAKNRARIQSNQASSKTQDASNTLMFDPILDSIKENDKQLQQQFTVDTSTQLSDSEQVEEDRESEETSSDIPEKMNIKPEETSFTSNGSIGGKHKAATNNVSEDDETTPLSSEYIISYFKNNLVDVISVEDGAPLTRKQTYFSLIRKLLLVKTAVFPNVLELFQIDYSCKKKPLYKGLEKNYMYEKTLGEHVVHYDLRYNLKTEHINYMTFLVFSLFSSKSISKVNKEKLLSDPYFAFSTVYQVILYNFKILNMYNTFQYNSHITSQKKKFNPVVDLDLDSDRDPKYTIASINYPFKPESKTATDPKKLQEKPMLMEHHKITDYLWKIPFGQGNYKPQDALQGHPQADKLNGFQILFFLNKWCQSNGFLDYNGLSPLINVFISLFKESKAKMKKKNQIVALVLWLTAVISYSKEDDLEFQQNILEMILNDPTFVMFDDLDYDVPFDEKELKICEKEVISRKHLRASRSLGEKQNFDLIINEQGDLEVFVEPKAPSFTQTSPETDLSVGPTNKNNIVLVNNTELIDNDNGGHQSKRAEEESDFNIENKTCVNSKDYYDPKHIINVTNTKSKNNFKKQLNKEISVRLNNLYRDKTIDQLVYDLGETQKIAFQLRTKSTNYIKLFDKHEVNYVALTSGKFGGRTKKNPRINDSVVGFQTDMVKLFRMNKKLLLKKASRMFSDRVVKEEESLEVDDTNKSITE